jgi:hypothetical protein
MSPLDDGFRRRTAKVFEDWHDAIAVALRQGQKLGLVRSDVDAGETATFPIGAYESIIIFSKRILKMYRCCKQGKKARSVFSSHFAGDAA